VAADRLLRFRFLGNKIRWVRMGERGDGWDGRDIQEGGGHGKHDLSSRFRRLNEVESKVGGKATKKARWEVEIRSCDEPPIRRTHDWMALSIDQALLTPAYIRHRPSAVTCRLWRPGPRESGPTPVPSLYGLAAESPY
jgi:hypothetical protein